MKFREIKPGMVIHCPKEEDARSLCEHLKDIGYKGGLTMSKAVLVLDEMPPSCGACKLEKNNHCCITGEWINAIVRPVDRCPLREMSEYEENIAEDYLSANWTDGYKLGWNDALRAIEGSGEDA